MVGLEEQAFGVEGLPMILSLPSAGIASRSYARRPGTEKDEYAHPRNDFIGDVDETRVGRAADLHSSGGGRGRFAGRRDVRVLRS